MLFRSFQFWVEGVERLRLLPQPKIETLPKVTRTYNVGTLGSAHANKRPLRLYRITADTFHDVVKREIVATSYERETLSRVRDAQRHAQLQLVHRYGVTVTFVIE